MKFFSIEIQVLSPTCCEDQPLLSGLQKWLVPFAHSEQAEQSLRALVERP